MAEDIHVHESLMEIARLLTERSKRQELKWVPSPHRPMQYTLTFPESLVKVGRMPISRQYEFSVSNEVGFPIAKLAVDGNADDVDTEAFDLLVELYELAQAEALNRDDVLEKLRARLSGSLTDDDPPPAEPAASRKRGILGIL